MAFLLSKVDGDVYVETAPGRDMYNKNGVPMAMKLKRSLYGISQSPAVGHGTIDVSLPKVEFTPIKSHPCVCTHGHIKDYDFAILTLYDDILVTEMNTTVLHKIKEAPKAQYATTDMGEAGFSFLA